MTTIGQRLQKFMVHFSLGNVDVADATGIPKEDVSRIKNDKQRLGIERLDKIAHTYPHLSIDWLLYGRGDMMRQEPLPEGLDRFTFELVNFIKNDCVKHDAALKFLKEK